MAFSQSFEFGDSTFMKLENEVKDTRPASLNNDIQQTKGLEIIQESPPNFKFKSQRMYTQGNTSRSNVSQRHFDL